MKKEITTNCGELPKEKPVGGMIHKPLSEKEFMMFNEKGFKTKDVKEAVEDLKKYLTDNNYYGDNSFTMLFKHMDEKIFGGLK